MVCDAQLVVSSVVVSAPDRSLLAARPIKESSQVCVRHFRQIGKSVRAHSTSLLANVRCYHAWCDDRSGIMQDCNHSTQRIAHIHWILSAFTRQRACWVFQDRPRVRLHGTHSSTCGAGNIWRSNMALKVILVVCLVLAASRGGDCQLGNLLGSLGDVVNSALSGASNTVNAAVNLATSVTANQGFNTGWWWASKPCIPTDHEDFRTTSFQQMVRQYFLGLMW